MAIVIINPNSTTSMTEAMVAAARKAAPNFEFDGWTSTQGPASIQGAEDGALATPPLLELVARAEAQGVDGIIIGCFDDTGLAEAARIASCPVIGIGQASYHYAALRQWRFSVVTTLSVSVPVLQDNIAGLGLTHLAARVRASEVPVLALEDDPAATSRIVAHEAARAAQEDAIEAVILGCAGMVQVVEAVEAAVDIAVIDPVTCAARCFAWLGLAPGT